MKKFLVAVALFANEVVSQQQHQQQQQHEQNRRQHKNRIPRRRNQQHLNVNSHKALKEYKHGIITNDRNKYGNITQSIKSEYKNKNKEAKKQQRIVLIAGPHKTGSTSIQNNMYRWTTKPTIHDNTNTTSTVKQQQQQQRQTTLLPEWSWPEPQEIFQQCNHYEDKDSMHGKIFYPFGEALHNCRILRSRPITEVYTCAELLQIYRHEFQRKWDQGYNLVIGTEAFDLVGSLPKLAVNKNQIDTIHMDDVIQHLPHQITKKDITIVVKYRSPRTKHLISWYHECCMDEMTFMAFLQNELKFFPDRGSRIIDSLHLVRKLAEEGYHVVLIDLSGVMALGYDVSNVIACDVLNANCTKNKQIIGEVEPPKISNVKSGGENFGRFDKKDMNEIEKIIRRRDCFFHGLEQHELVTVLYPKDYTTIMEACKRNGISRGQMNRKIRKVIGMN